MYSPKIRPELVAKLYRLARVKGVPMTKLVNDLIRDEVNRLEAKIAPIGQRRFPKNGKQGGRA